MYPCSDLLHRAKANNPVRTGLIGAGKFGSMFLSQVLTTHRFRWVKESTAEELSQLRHTIAYRIGRYLKHQGNW